MNILEGPSALESEKDIVDDPMEPIDPLYPPPSDSLVGKRPLWLHDTLQDVERYISAKRTFR